MEHHEMVTLATEYQTFVGRLCYGSDTRQCDAKFIVQQLLLLWDLPIAATFCNVVPSMPSILEIISVGGHPPFSLP